MSACKHALVLSSYPSKASFTAVPRHLRCILPLQTSPSQADLDDGVDVRQDSLGRSGGLIPLDRVAVGDQKLSKVPLDVLAKHGHEGLIACLLLELDVEGVGIGAVHVHLGEEGELCALALGKGLDLGVGTRLLAAELVAGEPQHSELVGADLGSQLDEFSIVGGSQASC